MIGCIITAVITYSYSKNAELKNSEHFKDLIEDQAKSITTNFEYYYEALEGGASLYAASENVSLDEWKAFLNRSQITKRRPGVNGLGVIVPVENKNINAFVQDVRKNDIQDFTIKKVPNVVAPRENANSSYIIKFIEPIEKNEQARGLDIGSEINRRTSAELARDTGLPTISKRITLVQNSKSGPGFLLYVPMYKTGSAPLTVEKRRQELTGWVYAPFITASFLNSSLIPKSKEFKFFVFEGSSITHENLVYSLGSKVEKLPAFEEKTTLELGQQIFTIGWVRSEDFISADNKMSVIVAIAGLIITFLFAWLVGNLETTNQRAQKIADSQTHLLKINEDKLKAALEKSNEAIRVKSEFLANMSHEIRTPMNGVLGMVQLLSETELNSKQEDMVDLIKKSGDSLMIILNDILDLSKIESGNIEFENVSFNLKLCVEETLSLFRHEASRKGIGIHFESLGNSDLWFCGDITRIKQILINLISNAVKFTENGSVTIKLDLKEIDSNSSIISIHVQDTGIGIADENKKDLFSKFSQADSSITRKFGGTGLGLSISSKLANLMGGAISFSSTAGTGSTFTFEISLEKGIESEITEKSSLINKDENLSSLYPHKILVVEDNLINQKLITMMLAKFGYSCDLASNGIESLETLNNNTYSLILMDMQMPEMDGVTATSKIIAKYGQDAPPIISVTANAFVDDIEKCKKAGMVDLLLKPISKDKLKEILVRYSSYKKISKKVS